MKQGILKPNLGRRGSAIIMALLIMTVLFLLGLAVITLSMGTLRSNAADAENNDMFYAAEAAVKSGIDQLKYEVAYYYNQMLTATSADYPTLYANFFPGISTNAEYNFTQLSFTGITTETDFSTGDYDNANDICEFIIRSTATVDNTETEYEVVGRLYVKKIDVRASEKWLDIDDAAYKVGGTLNLSKNGFEVFGGNVVTSAFSNPNNKYYKIWPPGEMRINSGVADTINNCLTYPSYTMPTITNPDVYVTVNNTILGSGSFPTNKPVVIMGAPGVNFTISGGTSIYPGSVVYCKGNLTLTPTMTATSPIYCYADGNITASQGPVYADLYSRGNTTTSGNFHGNITCDGNALIGGTFIGGTVKAGGNIIVSGGYDANYYAAGDISISDGVKGSNHVVYAGGNLTLTGGANANAVFFCGGDMTVDSGPTVTGAVIAKGNVTQSSWFTIHYSRSAIQDIMEDPDNEFFFGSTETPQIDDAIIGSKITAIGRHA